ncbi:MAG: hypothetical protein MJE77_05225 [Proteobacteria bacterium]|nr:hypothetical protein [Pseudomonadota bacterium]
MRTILIGELQRLKQRMKAHPIRVLLLAALLTGGVVKKVATKPRAYDAQVTLRVSQGTLSDERGSPLPNAALQDYIYSYVLNKKVLEERVIKQHGFFRDVYDDQGLEAALEELREFLNIRAYRNYFLYNRSYESTPRSVHLTIEYTNRDPEFAYKMVSVLADIVVNNESARRVREARFAAENAQHAVARAEELAGEKYERLNQAQYNLIKSRLVGDSEAAARAQVAIDELTEQLPREDLRLRALRREQQQIEFRLRLEESSLAILWEVVSEDRPRVIPPPGPIFLTTLAMVCFCIFVPICAIGFGTFDSRIHDLEDVTRLDMPAVGHVPSFEGDRVGSLKSRIGRAGRGLLSWSSTRRNRRVGGDRVA